MYDHYVAVDWSQRNMAIAKMTNSSDVVKVIDIPSDVAELQNYLGKLRGRKVLCIEETDTAQWLYTELHGHVDALIVCDPYRNHLLGDGAKNDRIDAEKLVRLLRAGMLKAVYHSWDELFFVRKLISGYDDLIKAGVMLKQQRFSLLKSAGLKDEKDTNPENKYEQFVLQGIDEGIERYKKEKKRYEEQFEDLKQRNLLIRNLSTLPGIGIVHSVKLAATVITAKRFNSKGQFLSYCGLVKHEKISGGRSYGKRQPRYSRKMKCVFKVATTVSLQKNKDNFLSRYFQTLMQKGNLPDHVARHAVCRRLAVLTFGVFKSGKPFEENRIAHCDKVCPSAA